MHSCSGWYSLFLPRCWRGVCAMLSVTHSQYCMEQWWREGKLFVGSAEPLLVPSIIASETTYVFVQNRHGINVTGTIQTHFHLLFPAGFFVPYVCPLEPLVHFFIHSWPFYHLFLANSIQHRNRYLLQIHHKVSIKPFILPRPLSIYHSL